MPAFDSASPNLDSNALVARGYGVGLRYSSPGSPRAPKTDFKLLTASEYQRHTAALIRVLLNYEWYETRCAEGAPAGREDVAYAKAHIARIGYAPGDPVLFSDDTAGTTRNALDGYFGAVGEQLPVDHIGYYGGLYKGLWLLDRGRISKVWCANAYGWSGIIRNPGESDLAAWNRMAQAAKADGRVHFLQHMNFDQPLGWDRSIDHNDVLRADYAGGANSMPLDPANPNDRDVIDGSRKMQAIYAIITGDPAANAKPNFFTDMHTVLGVDDKKLDQLSKSIQQLAATITPSVQTDAHALAAELAPLLSGSLTADETKVFLDTMSQRLAS